MSSGILPLTKHDIMTIALFIACLCGGYLLGSIPFGVILTRLVGAGDLRQIGSGNIGATNVLRTGRKGLALATLVLDGAKGAVAVMIAAALLTHEAGLVAGFGAFLGHLYPVWLRFKGGKGVATSLGILLAAQPPLGALACAVWLLMAVVFRYSSLAALVALALAPLFASGFGEPEIALLSGALAVLSWWRHRDNLRRLFKGEESKISFGKKAKSP